MPFKGSLNQLSPVLILAWHWNPASDFHQPQTWKTVFTHLFCTVVMVNVSQTLKMTLLPCCFWHRTIPYEQTKASPFSPPRFGWEGKQLRGNFMWAFTAVPRIACRGDRQSPLATNPRLALPAPWSLAAVLYRCGEPPACQAWPKGAACLSCLHGLTPSYCLSVS